MCPYSMCSTHPRTVTINSILHHQKLSLLHSQDTLRLCSLLMFRQSEHKQIWCLDARRDLGLFRFSFSSSFCIGTFTYTKAAQLASENSPFSACESSDRESLCTDLIWFSKNGEVRMEIKSLENGKQHEVLLPCFCLNRFVKAHGQCSLCNFNRMRLKRQVGGVNFLTTRDSCHSEQQSCLWWGKTAIVFHCWQ